MASRATMMLTITINTKRKEFRDQGLDPYEHVWEMCRIFQARLRLFLKDVKIGLVYGNVKAFIR